MNTKIVDTLSKIDFRGLKMPLAVVFKRPIDFPDNFVVRIFDIDIPINIVYLSENLEDCRKEISKIGLQVRVGRSEEDHKCIVETWC